MKDEEIIEFLVQYDYDVRKTENARWIDQKCTPDVLYIIADCILHYVDSKGDRNIEFSTRDIWDFEYSVESVGDYFNKVHVLHEKAKNEYDKFFAQPLKLFGYSHILFESKKGNRNIYRINNHELLSHIATSDRFAYRFLINYIPKVLNDSEIYDMFETFFTSQSKEEFKKLKKDFGDFTIKHTPINKHKEVNRIFTKIVNPLACYNSKFGTSKGYMSKQVITFSDLSYNQLNFRDVYAHKPKKTSREEWKQTEEYRARCESVERVIERETTKAKRILREHNCTYRGCRSEVSGVDEDEAYPIHHIFPKSDFKKISDYLENLIVLTPNQHARAHRNNENNPHEINYHEINKSYQKKLLTVKAKRIDENISNETVQTIYSFDKLVEVINIGLSKDYEIVGNSYNDVINIINESYSENI